MRRIVITQPCGLWAVADMHETPDMTLPGAWAAGSICDFQPSMGSFARAGSKYSTLEYQANYPL
ncbi:MAG: hypothetical protein ACQEXI_08925, partial [Pseudomonadota bacterium]